MLEITFGLSLVDLTCVKVAHGCLAKGLWDMTILILRFVYNTQSCATFGICALRTHDYPKGSLSDFWY